MSTANILETTEHRPWPLAAGHWAIRMRWTNLLFAHWPVPASKIAPLLPSGFAVDTYNGDAWVGVVPFRMEEVQLRGLPRMPGANLFAEANVRTYVRDKTSGDHGVYFFSLDANNPLAVIAARLWYHLPYYFASMKITGGEEGWYYRSRRLFARRPARLEVHYKSTDQKLPVSKPGTIEYFLTERYALFTHSRRNLIRGDIHHLSWPLEHAEAEFQRETLAAAQDIALPNREPILHYAKQLDVFAWPPRAIR
ncbi:MAG TPA: DUF2071 domain-containing protein [Bryobacteraceae bacterium]|nr:DUF2071 domain-containing protein [Bryobacteraceae bacterium]